MDSEPSRAAPPPPCYQNRIQPIKIAPAHPQPIKNPQSTPPPTPTLSPSATLLDDYQYHIAGYQRDPTTPPPHLDSSPLQHHAWGESLPPLKAVMAGYTASSTSLVLPCPFN